MKHSILEQVRRHLYLAGLALLLAGCAHLEHQTTESAPHALVTVTKRVDVHNDGGKLKSLDGLPVSAGQTYRLRPGSHELVTDFMETVVSTAKPWSRSLIGNLPPEPAATVRLSEASGASVSGQNPLASMQPANLVMETRRVRSVTNSLSVKAGGRYELIAAELIPR